RLGHQLADRLGRRDHLNLVAALELVARLGRLAVDLDQIQVDQPLNVVAREVGDAVDEVLVDPAGEVLADAEVVVLDVFVLRIFYGDFSFRGFGHGTDSTAAAGWGQGSWQGPRQVLSRIELSPAPSPPGRLSSGASPAARAAASS